MLHALFMLALLPAAEQPRSEAAALPPPAPALRAPTTHEAFDELLPKLHAPDAKVRREAIEGIIDADQSLRALYLERLRRHDFVKYTEAQRLLLMAAGVTLPSPSGWFSEPKLKPGEKSPSETDTLALLSERAPPGDGRREAYARALESLAVLRGLAGMRDLGIAEPLLGFAFEPYGITFRWEVVRAIRGLGGYAVPTLLARSYDEVTDWKKDRARYLRQQFAAHLLSTMEEANPRQALLRADRPLKTVLLAAYSRFHEAEALEGILELCDHDDPDLRREARQALLSFFSGKAPRARVKRLKLPGGQESDQVQKIYLNYRERAIVELQKAIERVSGGAYDRGIPGPDLAQVLFTALDRRRSTRFERSLAVVLERSAKGDLGGAIAAAEEILLAAPEFGSRHRLVPVYREEAQRLALAGDLAQAVIVLERALVLASGGPQTGARSAEERGLRADAAYLRALAHEAAGERARALDWHRQALGHDPTHAGALVALLHLERQPRVDVFHVYVLVGLAAFGAPALLWLAFALAALRRRGAAGEA